MTEVSTIVHYMQNTGHYGLLRLRNPDTGYVTLNKNIKNNYSILDIESLDSNIVTNQSATKWIQAQKTTRLYRGILI